MLWCKVFTERLKAPILYRTLSNDSISCYGKPMKQTNEIAVPVATDRIDGPSLIRAYKVTTHDAILSTQINNKVVLRTASTMRLPR